MESTYQIGPLGLMFRGEGPLAACVREEFEPALSAVENPDLIFDFSEAPYCGDDATISGGLRVGNQRLLIRNAMLRYSIHRGPGSQLVVNIAPDIARLKALNKFRRRFRPLNWSHLTLIEEVAKNFVYAVHDYCTQLMLLRHDATYVHASAIECNGRALLLAGRGGVGKSSFMLKAVLEGTARYLSDDLAVLDAGGRVFTTPKKMQIYGYNTVGEPLIRNALLRNRSLADLASWRARLALKGPKRVRRRISARDMFGSDSTTPSALVSASVFLERHESSNFIATELDAREFAYRCSTVLLEELNPFVEMSIAEHSATDNPLLPSVAEMQTSTSRVMEAALQGQVSPMLVRVPVDCTPSALADYLDRFFTINVSTGRNRLRS